MKVKLMKVKLMKIFLLKINIIFFLFFTGIVYSSDIKNEITESSQGKYQGIPSNYFHKPLAKQIESYRAIYDHALNQYQGNIDDIKTKPIDGLFLILKNAFALVNDGITGKYPSTDGPKTDEDENLRLIWQQWENAKARGDKEKYLDELENLWEIAKRYEHSMTSVMFQRFNSQLAFLIDRYKSGDDIEDKNKPSINVLKESFFDFNDIIFILYGNQNNIKNRNVKKDHFVNQFCNNYYTSYIAFFDVLSVKKTDSQRTKSDPHWSSVNGTYAMLQHDFAHIDAMIDSYSNDSRSLKYIKEVCKIQKIYREEENLNDATVLMNGLFMIIHEKSSGLREATGDNLNDFITSATGIYKDFMIDGLKKYKTDSYKFHLRDLESIAYGLNKSPLHDDQGPFYAFKDVRGMPKDEKYQEKVKALKVGYGRFWDYFLRLVLAKLP